MGQYEVLDQAVANGLTVSVVLPALNEERTVGSVVEQVLSYDRFTEVLVIDADSTDRTAEVAANAGATVVRQSEVRTDVPLAFGKGDTMWRGINVATGDLIVFMDSDLTGDVRHYAPLLAQQAVISGSDLTKGYYRRDHNGKRGQGGRTTEIAARPLLNMFWPQTAEVVQPLGGEYAVSRAFAHAVEWPTHFAVEVSLLIDAVEGPWTIDQVDLGCKAHESQTTQELGKMSFQIMSEMMRRLGADVRSDVLVQFLDGVRQEYRLSEYRKLPRVMEHDLYLPYPQD